MPLTYKKIATTVVSASTAATVEFTSIPSTYDDLVLQACLRANDNQYGSNCTIAFNGSASNKAAKVQYNDAAYSYTEFYFWIPSGLTTTDIYGSATMYIPNYTSSQNKTFILEGAEGNNGTQNQLTINGGLWSASSSITSITITCGGGSFIQDSTATLYGINKS